MGEKIAIEVIVGLVALVAGSLFTWTTKKYGAAIRSFFNSQAQANAALIRGRWRVTETYHNNDTATLELNLRCLGEYVSGDQEITASTDLKEVGKKFTLEGSTQNLAVNLTWKQVDGAETGTLSLVLTDDRELVGHGLYVYNHKAYTTTFLGKRT